MIAVSSLTAIVVAAVALSALAPIFLITFLIRDWRRGELW